VKPSLRSTGRRLKKLIYPYLPATLKGEYESYRFAQRTRVPNTVYLETTSACNLNCVMCAAQRHATKAIKPSGYMDLSLFKRLVDEIARDLPSIEYVYLHKDGEPLLHPDIVEMIQYASSRHPYVTLVTNATLLDERMARAILATPLQKIRFSVDGLTRQGTEQLARALAVARGQLRWEARPVLHVHRCIRSRKGRAVRSESRNAACGADGEMAHGIDARASRQRPGRGGALLRAVPRLTRCADTHARPQADLRQDARCRYRHHVLSAARSTSVVSRRIQYDTHSRS
jgi:uncharacterized Fe-S cluster-containing radical SAM superfamily protein